MKRLNHERCAVCRCDIRRSDGGFGPARQPVELRDQILTSECAGHTRRAQQLTLQLEVPA